MEEVETVDIIGQSITVIIEPVTRYFIWVLPNVGLQVRVIDIYTTIDDANNDSATASGKVPGLISRDVQSRKEAPIPEDAAGVVKCPKVRIKRIVRRIEAPSNVVWFSVENIVSFGERLD